VFYEGLPNILDLSFANFVNHSASTPVLRISFFLDGIGHLFNSKHRWILQTFDCFLVDIHVLIILSEYIDDWYDCVLQLTCYTDNLDKIYFVDLNNALLMQLFVIFTFKTTCQYSDIMIFPGNVLININILKMERHYPYYLWDSRIWWVGGYQ
jgi:hypothetical protein